MLKKVAVTLGIAVGAFALFVASRPADFRVERHAQIAASPAIVFGLVNDFHRWNGWSPWDKLDPAMQRTFTGPAAGPGAVYEWLGNNKVGQGRMTILESKPGELLSIRLEFIKPFAATNLTTFRFTSANGGSLVSWEMAGRNGFIGKLFCVFNDMDKMVGADFERGLAQMAALAEAEARRQAEAARAAAPSAPAPTAAQ